MRLNRTKKNTQIIAANNHQSVILRMHAPVCSQLLLCHIRRKKSIDNAEEKHEDMHTT